MSFRIVCKAAILYTRFSLLKIKRMPNPSTSIAKKATVFNSSLPILFLLGMILYGLVIRPYVFEQSIIPLEIVFISSAFFAASHLWG